MAASLGSSAPMVLGVVTNPLLLPAARWPPCILILGGGEDTGRRTVARPAGARPGQLPHGWFAAVRGTGELPPAGDRAPRPRRPLELYDSPPPVRQAAQAPWRDRGGRALGWRAIDPYRWRRRTG